MEKYGIAVKGPVACVDAPRRVYRSLLNIFSPWHQSLFTLIAYSCGDFLDVVLLRWMYSFTLNISLGLMQLFGFCFATTNLWKEARGHPSSWDFCAWYEESWNPSCCTAFPSSSDPSLSLDMKAFCTGLDCRLLLRESPLFTDAYFALHFVDSGMKAPTRAELANHMNDLMADISNGEEERPPCFYAWRGVK